MGTYTLNVSHSVLLVFFVIITVYFFGGCTKEKMPDESMVFIYDTSTVTDIDGNVYKTVKIGERWWMAENLHTTHFRNGKTIFQCMNNKIPTWQNIDSTAFCVGDYNDLYYNWYAVNDNNNIAPDGWHVATDEDYKTLEKYLGMSQNEADKLSWRGSIESGKLKKKTVLWHDYSSILINNASGFSAIPSTCRMFNGEWGGPINIHDEIGGLFAFWWTKSEFNADSAWYRHLDYKEDRVFRFYGSKKYGFSVRCVKDN